MFIFLFEIKTDCCRNSSDFGLFSTWFEVHCDPDPKLFIYFHCFIHVNVLSET